MSESSPSLDRAQAARRLSGIAFIFLIAFTSVALKLVDVQNGGFWSSPEVRARARTGLSLVIRESDGGATITLDGGIPGSMFTDSKASLRMRVEVIDHAILRVTVDLLGASGSSATIAREEMHLPSTLRSGAIVLPSDLWMLRLDDRTSLRQPTSQQLMTGLTLVKPQIRGYLIAGKVEVMAAPGAVDRLESSIAVAGVGIWTRTLSLRRPTGIEIRALVSGTRPNNQVEIVLPSDIEKVEECQDEPHKIDASTVEVRCAARVDVPSGELWGRTSLIRVSYRQKDGLVQTVTAEVKVPALTPPATFRLGVALLGLLMIWVGRKVFGHTLAPTSARTVSAVAVAGVGGFAVGGLAGAATMLGLTAGVLSLPVKWRDKLAAVDSDREGTNHGESRS